MEWVTHSDADSAEVPRPKQTGVEVGEPSHKKMGGHIGQS